ncbi:CheR family methyltransferase [Craterilacuibacter sp.]|uniref:CheR family methyltransferase n=1 Tax=Craterilacuibacter sp. TaxID=2870909 RepID=UPI003F40C2AB
MPETALSVQEFTLLRQLIYRIAGVHLADSKRPLVMGRLQKRLHELQLDSYLQYYQLLTDERHPQELQTMVNLLTTHETYFFRESQHFDYLRDQILAKRQSRAPFRVWSAACSSGEEAYTLAMLLSEHLPHAQWEVVGSDISTHELEKARRGHYPLARHEGIPPAWLKKYCLKGVRTQEGSFLVSSALRERVRFSQINLTQPIATTHGSFDLIFLRNVMIYFNNETKRQVIGHILPHLAPGGYLFIGHAETLSGISEGLVSVRPTIYRKLDA